MSYITEVADLFLSRCQSITILSPQDYAMIAEWEKQEIPLSVIFDSLNRVFDNVSQNSEVMKVESTDKFQFEIKENFADWLHNLKNVDYR
jgi:hypothetical protein